MSTIIAVFIFNFKNTFRNLKSSAIMFILPVVFMAIFGLAFGQESSVNFTLGVYQVDSSENVNLETIFKEVDEKSDNLEIKVTKYESPQKLESAVKLEEVNLGASLATNFTEGGIFEIIMPSNQLSSQIQRNIVYEVLHQIVIGKEIVATKILDENSKDLSGFDMLAPGLIIYGLIILIPGVANSFTQIIEKKYIYRFAFGKISSFEIIFGNVLFYLLIGIIQATLLYFTSLAFGYKVTGNIFLAIVPILLSLLFVIAVGLLIGSFFKKSEAATNTGTIISIIFGFFSGSFISGIGNILEFDLFGRTFQFNDFLPTKWGTQAVEAILTKNLGLADIQFELWILAISGIISLSVGVWVFAAKQLRYKG